MLPSESDRKENLLHAAALAPLTGADPPSAGSDYEAILDELKKHRAELEKFGSAKKKDRWDKLSVIGTLISSVLLATIGGIFTWTYQWKDTQNRRAVQEQDQQNRWAERNLQAEKEAHEQAMRELDLVTKLFPSLVSTDENVSKHAYLVINALGNTELMTKLALSGGGFGAKEALTSVLTAPQSSEADRQTAARALRYNTTESIGWFSKNFREQAQVAVKSTLFAPDLLIAIAYQETGYVWKPLAEKGLKPIDILRACVGDTLDKERTVFPKSKEDLESAPRGAEMFKIAREALVEIANLVPGYGAILRNPNKFCHGFGVFQYDIQYFKTDPDFFLLKKWYNFNDCSTRLVSELQASVKRLGWADRKSLSDQEMVLVAIASHDGIADPAKGLKQGYRSDDGRYYGENIIEYLRIARRVAASLARSIGPNSTDFAVQMPEKVDFICRRADPAGPHSLSEPDMPWRQSLQPKQKALDLTNIVDWLGVDNPEHRRYQPDAGSTFSNVYAHDLAYLAGAYLPRVWWTPSALESAAAGKLPEPLDGKTIEDMRSNEIADWFVKYGLMFGWSELHDWDQAQKEANNGAVVIIIGKRKDPQRSGFMSVVVPERQDHVATRSSGKVAAPLQTFAGVTCAKYSTRQWWNNEWFESVRIWMHQ